MGLAKNMFYVGSRFAMRSSDQESEVVFPSRSRPSFRVSLPSPLLSSSFLSSFFSHQSNYAIFLLLEDAAFFMSFEFEATSMFSMFCWWVSSSKKIIYAGSVCHKSSSA